VGLSRQAEIWQMQEQQAPAAHLANFVAPPKYMSGRGGGGQAPPASSSVSERPRVCIFTGDDLPVPAEELPEELRLLREWKTRCCMAEGLAERPGFESLGKQRTQPEQVAALKAVKARGGSWSAETAWRRKVQGEQVSDAASRRLAVDREIANQKQNEWGSESAATNESSSELACRPSTPGHLPPIPPPLTPFSTYHRPVCVRVCARACSAGAGAEAERIADAVGAKVT
jgi:hypothetical protein